MTTLASWRLWVFNAMTHRILDQSSLITQYMIICHLIRRKKSDPISFRFHIHFILGRPSKFSKQAALRRRLSKLMVNARASWCNSNGSKSKQHDSILMQNWNVILLNLISFLHLVAPAEIFCMVVTGNLHQSVGFPGASIWYTPQQDII